MPGLVEAGSRSGKASKNSLRRAKRKEKKAAASDTSGTAAPGEQPPNNTYTNGTRNDDVEVAAPPKEDAADEQIEIESFDLPPEDPLFEQYRQIASRFIEIIDEDSARDRDEQKVFHNDDNDDIPDEEEEEEMEAEMERSAKRRKKESRLSVAELKAIAKDPMLVEDADRTASDPLLLLSIKAQRNVVPVPAHWSQKREYLSSKRGIEKSSFMLPKFIQDTGIQEMREAVLEKQGEASLKQKQRERVQPKMGKLDIDYQKLYEAFFRHQTKPVLTRYGELYFEGKENETNSKHLRPGEISDELREALAMGPTGPPPWLMQMQRFGAPPGYPGMLIPGLNAPIPYGADWGFEPGQYGRPPEDEHGNAMFGGIPAPQQAQVEREPVDKTLWGELKPPEEGDEDEEDDDEEEEEEGDADGDGTTTVGGLQTPSGTFTPGGIATAAPTEIGGIESVGGDFTLRKGRDAGPQATTSRPSSGAPAQAAYEILPEQNIRSSGFFGGERAYDLGKVRGDKGAPVLGHDSGSRKRKAGDVEVSVDVDALQGGAGLSKDELRRQYEAAQQANASGQWKGKVDQEDLSAMIDEESNKRLKKDREHNERRRQGRN